MSRQDNPELWLPQNVLDAIKDVVDHRDELYKIGCAVANKFRDRDLPIEECLGWLFEHPILKANYTGRQYEYQLNRAVWFAYDSYDPDRVGKITGPEFVQELTALAEAVEASNVQDKKYLLGLIQHAVNTGHNPVNCSSRQLAALVGSKSYTHVANVMNRMAASKCGGFIANVTYDGVFGHSRLWHLATDTVHITMHDIYVLSSPEERFVQWVSESPIGSEFTVSSVSSHLNISRGAASKLLVAYTDVYFGGGNFPGSHKARLPAKWWRDQTVYAFPALPVPKKVRKPRQPKAVPVEVDESDFVPIVDGDDWLPDCSTTPFRGDPFEDIPND